MATLMSLMTSNGGANWHRIDPRDPEVFTLEVTRAKEGCRTGRILGVQYPANEVGVWAFDLDAIRESVRPEIASHFPSWVRGTVTMKPDADSAKLRFDITPEALE